MRRHRLACTLNKIHAMRCRRRLSLTLTRKVILFSLAGPAVTPTRHESTALGNLLRKVVRRGRVLTAPSQMVGYDADGLGYKRFRPDAVVIPADLTELHELLRYSCVLDVPVVIRGAGTSLSGGPVAAQGGVIIHTSALRGIREVCRDGLWCEVECGVTLAQLDRALQPLGLFYPPDPSSGIVCTIGGNVAMNAGGAHCFRHGVTGNYVLGVEAVMLDGSVHRFGGPAGGRGPWREDWKRLMVGSEGTLAAFTRFWLRLLPVPERVWTFRATYLDLQSAERAIHALVSHPACPVAIELMDPRCVALVESSAMAVGLPRDAYVLITEIDGPAELVRSRVDSIASLLEQAGATTVAHGDDPDQREKLWRARKVAGGLMGQLSPDLVVQDAVIPKRALAETLKLIYDESDAAGIPVINVFHAGDGNLHPNFIFDSRRPGDLEKVEQIGKRFIRRVVEVGGTLSGEHGIGNDKMAYMPLVFSEDAIRVQLAIAAIFNPLHQLNPLKVFAGRRFGGHDSSIVGEGTVGGGAIAELSLQPSAEPPTRDDPRLFPPMLDPLDGVICIFAGVTPGELHERISPHRLRFPLLIDPTLPLDQQVEACGYAPASSRFGPLCDNIIGMNWRLPNGNVIRVGERVVKSTTGYDLLRFLLGSCGRLGKPIDFVLRLRPAEACFGVANLTGDFDSIKQASAALLRSDWLHWFDSVDLVIDRSRERRDAHASLRVVVNLPMAEWPMVERYLESIGSTYRLQLEMGSQSFAPTDGLPDLFLKTTPDRVAELANSISIEDHTRCVASLAVGAALFYYRQGPDTLSTIKRRLRRIAPGVHELGGECGSRRIAPQTTSETESTWLATFAQKAGFV